MAANKNDDMVCKKNDGNKACPIVLLDNAILMINPLYNSLNHVLNSTTGSTGGSWSMLHD